MVTVRIDALAQVVQFGAGELPVKRRRSDVVPVLEGQQPGGKSIAVCEIGGRDDLPLDDGEDDYLEPGSL